CQWIAARLGNDTVADPLIDRTPDHGVEYRSRLRITETPDDELRQPGQLLGLVRLAHREDQRDGLRSQATSHEGERLRGSLVEPVDVVDDAEQRPLPCGVGQQPEAR